VVREGARRSWSSLPFVAASPADEPHGYVLSSADATLVRDFLVRRGSMHPTARADLARRIATAIAQRYNLPLDAEAEPERLLERLSL
jgi:hypothetical protein